MTIRIANNKNYINNKSIIDQNITIKGIIKVYKDLLIILISTTKEILSGTLDFSKKLRV